MFERYACWDAIDATKILRPLALEGNEAVFRATHSPISGLVVTGSEAHSVPRSSEEGLLESLSSSGRRHAMCVVEGEAGSGKSHLIRWLKVYWRSASDLPVLIERADGTLDGTLRQLNSKLSAYAGTSLESIVPRNKLTDQGQWASLLLQLSNLCRSGTLSEPLPDEEWCDKHGLADMLQADSVRSMWKAPERVLDVLTKGTDRDSRVARFTAADVCELRQPLAGLKGRNVGPGAIRLAYLLRGEAQAVASALGSCPPGADEPDLSTVAPNTSKFLAALNSRLSLAIQSAMGISGAALQKIFRDLRRVLKKRARRLVLLLEDLTGAQGVDQELLYLLQESSTTQEDFCDMVSVVGLTPAYFRQYVAPQANVVQRITHHVRFGRSDGSFQAVSAIENPSEQVAFAARYLRTVRAGMAEVDQAAQDNTDIVNKCAKCLHRKECHESFGHVDGIGLYPLTEKAIGRMFSSLRHPQGTMFLQTPRALIQSVLAPSLSAVSAIAAGVFPVPTIETEYHPLSAREVRGLAREHIERAPEEHRERLRTTVAWWGDGGIPTAGDEEGEWAGVPQGVFRSWGLPMPASSVSPATFPPRRTSVSPEGAEEPLSTKPSQAESEPGEGKPSTTSAEGKKAPSTSGKSTPRAKLDKQFERLANWLRSKRIDDDGFWWARAEAVIRQINWKAEDIPYYFAGEALGEVRLQGSGRTDYRNIVIPCTKWAARGLEWHARLDAGELAPGERDFATQAVAVFAQNVRNVVRTWVLARVPEVQPGSAWHFEATVAQVLLARAWLRGETRPGAPMVEQWKAILSDDSPGGAARRPGAVAWGNAVDDLAGDSQLHKRLRSLAECGEPIADVALAASAIRMLVKEGRLLPFPEKPPEQPIKTKWLSGLATSAGRTRRALAELPAREVGRLRERSIRILDTVGETGFALYLERAANAFSKVREDLPNQVPSDLAAWFKQFESQKALLKPGPGSTHDRLHDFLEARSWESLLPDSPISVLLDLAIQAPAEPLESTFGLINATSTLVDALVAYLSQHEASTANLKDAATVVAFGRRIAEKAAELKEIVS